MKKQKKTMRTPLMILALLLAFNFASAQHDHSSHDHSGTPHEHKAEPPHGGTVKDVGKYHLEILFEPSSPDEKLNVYVLKSNLKTATVEGITGTVQLHYKDGTHKDYALQASGNEKLFCTPADMVQPFVCIITIKIKDKTYSTNTEYKGFGK